MNVKQPMGCFGEMRNSQSDEMNASRGLTETYTNDSHTNWTQLRHVATEDQMEMSAGLSAAGVVFGIIVVAMGVFGNVLIILAVVLSKPLCKTSNIFVVSLAACDLFQTVMVKPLYIQTYVAGGWTLGREVCLYALFASNLAILESILHVVAIAFHRYVMMVHPKRAPCFQKLRSILIMLAVIYILPICFTVLPSLPKIRNQPVSFNRIIMFCSFVRHNDFRLLGVVKKVVFLALAAAFLLFCYVRIYQVVHTSGRSINESQGSAFSPLRLKREMMLLKTIMVIFMTFLVSYLPLSVLYAIDKHRTFPYLAYFFTVILLWMSSSINWVIYGSMNRQYRQAFRLILCGNIYHVNAGGAHKENGSTSRLSQNESFRISAHAINGVDHKGAHTVFKTHSNGFRDTTFKKNLYSPPLHSL